jgi:hypothetical protein
MLSGIKLIYIFLISFIGVLSISIFIIGDDEYKPDPNLEEKVRRSVVKVIRYGADGKPSGTGTGFFVTSTKIITNRHVINEGSKAVLISVDGEQFPIRGVSAYDPILDVVLLETDVPFNKFDYLSTSSFLPNVGDTVIIIGNPWGRGPRTSSGRVTDIQEWEFIGKVIGYNAPTFPGNSGSPVFTPDGDVIGIATWGKINSKTPQGYAIPYERVLDFPRGTVEAIDDWNTKMKNNDKAKQAYERGRQYLKAGNFPGAVKEFKNALNLNQEFAECWLLLGLSEYKMGLFDEAADDYKKAIRYRHDFKEAYFNLAIALDGMSKFDEAIEAYEKVLVIDDADAAAYYKLGCLYIEIGNKKAAQKIYMELLDLDSARARTLREYIEKKFNNPAIQ